ncbi:Ero1like proteinlike [Caligus rogercresseyi]|uniref:Ero1like proteinlike n=1 Tax=Caligus rogercresseyi TaxID=217165 RepID=A0A7T8H0C0_CALRO|nr:Ero1like proteinlike [Caligus rogercresseyi]
MEDLPEGIIAEDSAENQGRKRKYTPLTTTAAQHKEEDDEGSCAAKENTSEEDEIDLGVDGTLSEQTRSDLEAWKTHDESVIDFCDRDEEYCPDCDYVDLTRNPERFTGYDGEAAHRIWRAIYEENCFRPENTGFKEAFLQSSLEQNMCLEKRAFYRALSGLHSSITIHLCANYLLSRAEKGLLGSASWGPNLDEFIVRFDPRRTKGQGPFWLKNLYFVYLLELRAITKASRYFEGHLFYTGNEEEDKDTQIAIKELMNLLRSFPAEDTFDERTMFASKGTQGLKSEFRNHFHNITRLMDCVECDKCKLWGKLQTTGLGTALKLLFSDTSKPNFYLTRNEIVALFNAFGRISTSIQQVEKFREMMRPK